MNKIQLYFRSIFGLQDGPNNFWEVNERKYRRLSLTLFLAMISIALGPVATTAILSYNNYLNLLQAEEKDQLQWRLEGSVKAFNSMINSLLAKIQYNAENSSYQELVDDNKLIQTFYRTKGQFPFVTDLGVIDQNGIQQGYSGPYELKGQDYSKEKWFREIFSNSPYMSSVYLGNREVEHFAIAVSKVNPANGKSWILRATVDAKALQGFVHTIKTNASEDLFLINNEGILQTNSLTLGKALTPYTYQTFLQETPTLSINNETFFHAIGKIEGTPWSLVLVEKRYLHHEKWVSFKRRLILLLICCSGISLIVVYFLVSTFRKKLRQTDEIQMNIIKEAEHTNKLASIGRLAAGVGHEINNPLAIINQKNGLAEDLLELSPNFEHKTTITNCLKSINQSIDRCKAITHRLLGFARRSEIVMEPVQLNDIIKEVLTFLDNTIIHNKIQMELRLEPDLPLVNGDHNQLQQVFLNIINNAIDAIGKNGDITILTCNIAGDIQVIIQDSGHGISEKNLAHIFEPFYTTKETGKGTGLGLSITYGLIKDMGGDISVKSQLGKGTAFTISLPMSKEKNDNE